MKNSQKGFAPVAILIIAIAVLAIGAGTYVVLHKQEPAQNSNITQNTSTIDSIGQNENWKTYRDENYGFEFKYPSTWFIRRSSDGESLSFTKTQTTLPARAFASFYINNLNVGKEGAPRYVTPQEYFNYYFGNDPRATTENQPALQSLQFGQIPVVHHLVVGDNRYIVYTSDRQLSFILYPGNTQNPTEYVSTDNALMEQVIKTLVLTNSSRQFVKLTLPTPISTKETPTTQSSPIINVAGMKQYTDSSFGFSFYYPTSWTVQNSATRNNYAGGSVQKTLTIAPPGASNGDAITIDEFYSPTREVTIPRDLCSPMSGSFVAEHRYYFDTNTHTWMVEVPAYTGQSEKDGSTYSVPASTKAADVSQNTMGGLHMLGAGCSGSIIPLSAKNFVVFTFYSRNVGPYYINIAKTITATDPSVATPVSLDKQIQTITNAGVLLGAIGTKIGQWYVTSEHVYTWTGDIVAGANPSTFRLISTYSDGTGGTPYATDGVHIYSAWSAGTPALSGADPSTFIAIRQQYQIPYAPSSGRYGESFAADDNSFAKDKSHVWYQGKLIPNADPNTFIVTGNTHVENASGGYTLAHDSNHTYGIDKQSKLTIDGVTIQ